MAELPTGTVTFLFTDIEGSTRLLQELADEFTPVLERHQAIIRAGVARFGGVEIKTEGDSFFCVFSTAPDGLAAAVEIQRGMAAEEWPHNRPVRVRIGLHTGVGALGGDDYVGIDVNRGARISETGHGGQVLVSAATQLLGEASLPDGVGFRDLGDIHLKDLDHPEHVFQLVIDGLESDFPPLRRLVAGPSNLPEAPSRFVGREQEEAEVIQLLDESRLVTLTGVAGAGKSRLALEVGRDSRDRFPDGVWFVELAQVTSDDLVAQAVAHALDLQESPDRTATEVLSDYLRQGKRLLLLDNCEDLIEGVRDLVTGLIATTQDLRILATSQRALDTPGERRYQCPPLTMPPVEAELRAEVVEFDAVTLFEIRAADVDPSFVIDDENAAVVAAICRRLDGVPLAIELAAALVRLLTPQQILERLDDRFELLTGGPRSAPERQQSLRAALDSTFELLDGDEQEFAARLAVFAGGFDVAAAEAVAAGGAVASADVVEVLSSLVDRSLVTSSHAGGALRLTIPESVRAYLLARLEQGGQLLVRQIAHARYFGEQVEEASRGLRGPDQELSYGQLEANIENIRAAIAFTSETGDDTGLRLATQMFLYWRTRGDWSDGLHWTRIALDNTPEQDSGLRARALAIAGYFASDIGDRAGGIPDLERALEMARRVGDRHAEGHCASFLGAELSRRDLDLDRGLALLQEAQGIYAEIGEPYGGAWVDRYLALSHQERGSLDEAITLHSRSLQAFQDARDSWNTRFAQTLLAEAMHTVGELKQAQDLYDESLRGTADARFKVVIAHAHKGLGKVSLAGGRLDEAAEHLEIASQELQEIGDVACVAETKGHMAMVNLAHGHPHVATKLLVDALYIFRDITDQGGLAWSLERLAAVEAESGSHERAAEMLGAAVAIRERTGSMRPVVDQPDFDRLQSEVEQEVGKEAFRAAAAAGAALDFAEAVALGTG